MYYLTTKLFTTRIKTAQVDISFSTAWADGDTARLLQILPHVDYIEVGSKGDSSFFKKLEDIIDRLDVRVASVHAVAGPHKEGHTTSYTPHFASNDPSLQAEDIYAVSLTAEWAATLGASTVVLHAGKIVDETLKALFLEYKSLAVEQGSKEGLSDLRKEIVARRAIHKDHLDAVVLGLEKLCRTYPQIHFCFETRLHYFEIPTPNEADYIFSKLPLPNLGYWHDIGHTWTLDRLGLIPMTEWQHRFGDRCRGVHVHDTDSSLVDHYPPGFGSMNLSSILGMFDTDLFTLEVNGRHTAKEVINGISNLRDSVIAV
jgi:sugar phosphate isomerase/epimerase